MNTNQQTTEGDGGQFLAGLALCVVASWAYVVETFLHSGKGHNYVAARAPVAGLLLLFYPLFWDGHDCRPFFGLFIGFIVANGIQRAACVFRRWRGELIHSQSSGWARLKWIAPRMTHRQFKHWCEPPLVIAVGAVLCGIDPVSGVFVMVAGTFLFINETDNANCEFQRVVGVNDSVIESQLVADRFREMTGRN